jgi:hypothetical protein
MHIIQRIVIKDILCNFRAVLLKLINTVLVLAVLRQGLNIQIAKRKFAIEQNEEEHHGPLNVLDGGWG